MTSGIENNLTDGETLTGFAATDTNHSCLTHFAAVPGKVKSFLDAFLVKKTTRVARESAVVFRMNDDVEGPKSAGR